MYWVDQGWSRWDNVILFWNINYIWKYKSKKVWMLLQKLFQHFVFDFRAAWKHDVALIGMKDWGGWQSCLAEKTAWIIIIFCCWRSNTNVSQGFFDSSRLDFNFISSLDKNESIVEGPMLCNYLASHTLELLWLRWLRYLVIVDHVGEVWGLELDPYSIPKSEFLKILH